jgi:hypothetical protein
MHLDSELREILDASLNNLVTRENLDGLHSTWNNLRAEGRLNSYKDFVFGNINGIIINLYTTYNGKTFSELLNNERDGLDDFLNKRIYGLSSIVNNYMHNNNLHEK